MTNWIEKYQAGKIFLQPNSSKLPSGYKIPYKNRSSELAISIGGENGEPAYLIPSFKYGIPLSNPIKEFNKTREHLGGPFKTWQEADKWEREIRHPYVEKGQPIPSPLKYWGEGFQEGGTIPKAQEGETIPLSREIPEITVYGKKKYLQELDKQQQKYLADMVKYKQDSAAYQSYQDSLNLYTGVLDMANNEQSTYWNTRKKEIIDNYKRTAKGETVEYWKKAKAESKDADKSWYDQMIKKSIDEQKYYSNPKNIDKAIQDETKKHYNAFNIGTAYQLKTATNKNSNRYDYPDDGYFYTNMIRANNSSDREYKEYLNYFIKDRESELATAIKSGKNQVSVSGMASTNIPGAKSEISNAKKLKKLLSSDIKPVGYTDSPESLRYPIYKKPVVEPPIATKPIRTNVKYDSTYENLQIRPLWATMAKQDTTSKIGTLNPLDPLYEKGFTYGEAQKFPEEIRKQYKLDYPIYQKGGEIKPYDDSFKANLNRTIGKVRSKIPESFWFLPGMSDIDDALYLKQAFSNQGSKLDKIISIAGLTLPVVTTKTLKALPIAKRNFPYKQVQQTSEELQKRGAPAAYAYAVAEGNWDKPLISIGDKTFYRGVHLPVVPGGKYADDRLTTPLRPSDVDISSQGFRKMEEYAIDPDLPRLQGIDEQNIASGNYYHNGLWTSGTESIADHYGRVGRFKVTHNQWADKIFKDPNSTKVVYRETPKDIGNLPVGIVQSFKPIKPSLVGIDANDNVRNMISKFYGKPASEISLQEGRDFLNRARIDFTRFNRPFEDGYHFLPGRITPTNNKFIYDQGGIIPKAQEGVKIQADRRNWLQRTNDKIQTAYNKNKPQLLKDFPLLDLPGMVVEYVTGHSKDPDAGLAMVNPVGKIGKAIKVHQAAGKFKAKEKGINFVKNWIEHPESQKRINEITNLSDVEVLNQALQNGVRSNPGVPPEEIRQYIENKAFLMGINERLKKDLGVLGPELFSTKNLNRGYLVPQSRILNKGSNTSSGTIGLSWKKGNFWIARETPRKAITSNVVHEATHNLTGNRDNIKIKELTDEAFGGELVLEKLRQAYPQYVNDINYFSDPTEVYARVMELRNQFKLKPGQIVDKKLGEKIFTKGALNITPVDTKFFKLMQIGRQDLPKRGGAWFTDLFNKLPATVPIGIVGSSMYMNNQNKDKE